jgi:hypothetical protein
MKVERHTVVTLSKQELQEAVEAWVRNRDGVGSAFRGKCGEPPGRVTSFRIRTRGPKLLEAEITFEDPCDEAK